jgi:glyoxylase-like metal-dependent hydrolase (beta-lactamase superfamily II)
MSIQKHLLTLAGLVFFAGQALCHESSAPAPSLRFIVKQLTERVFVVHGPQAFPNPITRGFMNNPGFVVTGEGVVVIDPGSSVKIGDKVLESIRRVTDKPVVAVFNTHVHGDHWLGNQAIRDAYPQVPIYAHRRMIERVESGEGKDWVRLFGQLTAGATDGTRVVSPNIGLEGGESLTIGDTSFRIHHTGRAHSDTDIMIESPADGAIFLGDIVTNRRIQSARPADGDIRGQIRAVEFALSTDSDWFIPGHGLSGGREVAQQQLRFLQDLYASVKRHYEKGLADYEMLGPVRNDLAEYSGWYNFDELGRVLSNVYLKVEEEAF